MDRNTVFQKTAAGQQEITARIHKDLARLRPVLIMVDGKASLADLMVTAGKFCNVTEALEQLLSAGLIEVAKSPAIQTAPAAPAASATPATAVRSGSAAGGAPTPEALRSIVRALYDALGPHADDLAMRIEKCRTNADLVQLVEKCRDTVQQVAGRRKAEEFMLAANTQLPQTP